MPPTRFKAVLFDLGDTLIDFGPVDSKKLFAEATRNSYDHLAGRGVLLPAFERYGHLHQKAIRRAFLLARLFRREVRSLPVLTRVARRLGLPSDDESMLELAWIWYGPLYRLTTLADDVIPTLRALRDANLKLALVSNTFIAGKVHDRHLAELGLLDLLPTRVYSSEFGFPKPSPRIFRHALNLLGVAPAEAVFVGDLVQTDMIGAFRVGMTTVHRPSPASKPAQTPCVHHTIGRLAELPAIVKGQALNPPARSGESS